MTIYNHMKLAAKSAPPQIKVGADLIIVANVTDNNIKIFDPVTLDLIQTITTTFTSISVSNDGSYLVIHRGEVNSNALVYIFNGTVFTSKSQFNCKVSTSSSCSDKGCFSPSGNKYFVSSMVLSGTGYPEKISVYNVGSTFSLDRTLSTSGSIYNISGFPTSNLTGTQYALPYSSTRGLQKFAYNPGVSLTIAAAPNNPSSNGIQQGRCCWNSDYSKFLYIHQGDTSIRLYNANITSSTTIANSRYYNSPVNIIPHPATNGWIVTQATAATSATIGLSFALVSNTGTFTSMSVVAPVIWNAQIDPLDDTKILCLQNDGTLARFNLGTTSVSNRTTILSGLGTINNAYTRLFTSKATIIS